jgi:hypothetical protein
VTPQDTSPKPEGYALNGWTAAAKQQYLDDWHKAHPVPPAKLGEVENYVASPGYNDTADHIANFFHAIETREHVVEDEVFGNNTAIACHMANHSYFKRNVAIWDEATKTIKDEYCVEEEFLEGIRCGCRGNICGHGTTKRRNAQIPHRTATLQCARPAAQGL